MSPTSSKKKTSNPIKPYKRIVVPFRRTLHSGSRGKDVLALKRALNHARTYPGQPKNFTLVYGDSTIEAVRSYQRGYNRRHPKAKRKLSVTGVYNEATHRCLVAGRHYDAYGAWLMAHTTVAGVPAGQGVQEKLVAYATYLISKASMVHYSQKIEGSGRRMQIVRDRMRGWPPLPHAIYEDCSSSVTGLYWLCGLPDPNGRGYDGYGYTGTQVVNGQRIALTPGAWRIGDLLIYGNSLSDTRHVAMLIGKDGRVFSHGSESGPVAVPWNYRGDLVAVRRYF